MLLAALAWVAAIGAAHFTTELASLSGASEVRGPDLEIAEAHARIAALEAEVARLRARLPTQRPEARETASTLASILAVAEPDQFSACANAGAHALLVCGSEWLLPTSLVFVGGNPLAENINN